MGKLIRLNRLFAHPSGRLCSIAVDHFIGYGEGMPEGLRHIQSTLRDIVAGRPDALTMHKGMLASAWAPYAGVVPAILQSSLVRPDDTAFEQGAVPEDAIRLGADAIAVVGYVRGASEAAHLRVIAECVHQAAPYDLPVICHIYPRNPQHLTISFAPEDIAWAARCAAECGVDVIKVPYCGDVQAYAEIVADAPVPVVAAGGPKAATLEAALQMLADVVASGARGATIGRNVWGFAKITANVCAFKAVIHDGLKPEDAMRQAGL